MLMVAFHPQAGPFGAAEELAKQAAERKARGRWARFRAAWRGQWSCSVVALL